MWWTVHNGMGWWMLFGTLWMIIFWGAIIWLVVWGVGSLAGLRKSGADAMEIARQRYARGEITREEYEAIRGTLSGS